MLDSIGVLETAPELVAEPSLGFDCAPKYNIGSGLMLDPKTNTLSVDTADAVEKDNTKPVTSAAVFVEIGNIEALLAAL